MYCLDEFYNTLAMKAGAKLGSTPNIYLLPVAVQVLVVKWVTPVNVLKGHKYLAPQHLPVFALASESTFLQGT